MPLPSPPYGWCTSILRSLLGAYRKANEETNLFPFLKISYYQCKYVARCKEISCIWMPVAAGTSLGSAGGFTCEAVWAGRHLLWGGRAGALRLWGSMWGSLSGWVGCCKLLWALLDRFIFIFRFISHPNWIVPFSQTVGNTYGNFSLATMFPRREFTKEDYGKKLSELELAPSASVVLLPASIYIFQFTQHRYLTLCLSL